MFRFIALRILQFPLILAIIYLLTFSLAWLAPGSPFERNDRKLSKQAVELRQRQMHAENPWTFLTHYPYEILRHGNFGPSLAYDDWNVNDILRNALPVSVALGLFAMAIATFFGVTIGALGAVNRGGAIDWLSLTIALIGISVPSFVIASVLLIAFSSTIHWYTIGSWGSVRSMVLPGIALSLMPMAYIARLMRVSMIDVLGNDYVRTAKAKGLSTSAVLWKHCLRNAFLPVLSYLGPAAAATLTGSFVIESAFDIHGLGEHFVDSVKNRDQTLILGTVVIYSVFLLTLNLLVDIGYAFLDPRIDVTSKAA